MSVYIGIPSYDGKLHWATMQGLLGVANICAKNSVGLAVDVVPHDAFIGRARNMLVNRFMSSGMQDLMFVDADIGFDPTAVVDLCKAAPDIVMGLYMMKSPQPRYPALMEDPIVRHPSDMRLIKLKYGPTGFMRVRRRVFEKMMEKWPEDYYFDGLQGKIFDFFPNGRFDHHFTGEDIKFCERAITCGIDMWALQGISLRHFGEKSWDSVWQIDRVEDQKPQMGATDGYQRKAA